MFGYNKKNGRGMPKGMSDVAVLSIDKAFIVDKKISGIKFSIRCAVNKMKDTHYNPS